MPMLATRPFTASRSHGQRTHRTPATESRIAAQRDVADAAHAPRFAHLARPCADRGAPRHHRTQRLHRRHEQDEARRRAGRPVLGLVDVADRRQARRHQDPPADPARTGGSGPGRRAASAVAGREHERAAGEAAAVRECTARLHGGLPAGRLRRPGPQADPGPPHGADRPQHLGALAQRWRARLAQPVLAGPAVPLFRHPAR